MIIEAVLELISDSAPRPDAALNIIYKEYINVLMKPYKKVCGISLDTGKLPERITKSKIIATFKGNNESKPSNYCQVAFPNNLTKIVEIILRKNTIQHRE